MASTGRRKGDYLFNTQTVTPRGRTDMVLCSTHLIRKEGHTLHRVVEDSSSSGSQFTSCDQARVEHNTMQLSHVASLLHKYFLADGEGMKNMPYAGVMGGVIQPVLMHDPI